MKSSQSLPFILLATRNGERFLEEQIDSLAGQSLAEWRLLVRDDGSEDHTCDMIDAFAARDHRVERLPSPRGGVGSSRGNFAILLQAAFDRGAGYVFCCDQDDVWLPGKLERVLDALRQCEGPEGSPCLVHHDLEVVDEHLGVRSSSFWNLMAIDPGTEQAPQRLLSRNEVTGCALACNRALLAQALPVPPQAIMHDWWLALHAAFLGRLRPLPERLVRYRQHERNVVGAKSYLAGLHPFRNWRARWRAGDREFLDTARQARAFAESLATVGDPGAAWIDSVQTYASLPALPRRSRLPALRRAGAWRGNPLLDAVLLARVLTLPRQGEP